MGPFVQFVSEQPDDMPLSGWRSEEQPAVRIRFRTTELRSRAADVDLAKRAWGTQVGDAYVERLAVLASARNMASLRQRRSLRVHALKGRRSGTWAINLSGAWRLVFEYDADENAILVLEVTDYHG